MPISQWLGRTDIIVRQKYKKNVKSQHFLGKLFLRRTDFTSKISHVIFSLNLHHCIPIPIILVTPHDITLNMLLQFQLRAPIYPHNLTPLWKYSLAQVLSIDFKNSALKLTSSQFCVHICISLIYFSSRYFSKPRNLHNAFLVHV